MLQLLKAHLPEEAAIPNSTKMFYRWLPFSRKGTTTHFVSKTCASYIGEDSSHCVKCNVDAADSFLLLDPRLAISRLLNVSSVATNLMKNLEAKSQRLTQGAGYSSLKLGPQDFTCLLNTDGVPVFKSSNSSHWSVL